MKSLFLATAAVAAFAAAPAFAQDAVGSNGVSYSYSEADIGPLSGDAEGIAIDTAFAIPVTSEWTVTLDGGFAYNLEGAPNSDDSNLNGRVHVGRQFGNVRVAGFAGGQQLGDEQMWSFGAQAQTYMDKLTLTGGLAYETIEGADADIWSVGGDAAYFINPNLRVNAGAGWTNVDVAGGDTDGWNANLGGEYRIPNSPISVSANYGHAEFEDLDLTADTFTVGFRFSFGGDLQTRERAGADLGRTVAGVGAIAGAF